MLKQATIVFFPRTDQKLKNGKYPIYARVVLDREKFEFSTKQFIDNLVEWDDVIQRIKKRSPVNSVLNEIEHEIVEAYNFLKYHNRQLTALALRNQLKGDSQKRTRLLDFVDDRGGLILTSALVYKLIQINSESIIQQHNETAKMIRKDIIRQDINIAETNRKISTLESRRKVTCRP